MSKMTISAEVLRTPDGYIIGIVDVGVGSRETASV